MNVAHTNRANDMIYWKLVSKVRNNLPLAERA
jgi:hypothetical protein